MQTPLCAVLLVLVARAAFAYSTCEEDIQQELERERKEDADSHGCRACCKMELEAAPNCPAKGYDCDESLQVTSSVISVGSCECAQLRCAADNATLAVDGELVEKVHCKDHKWTSASGEAESAVCARECGVRICPVTPVSGPFAEIFFTSLAVQPPDDDHRCAWADCQYGAFVTYPETQEKVFKGPASFACTGNRMWSYTGPEAEMRNLILAYCIKSDCKSLQFSDDNPLCKTKYSCSEAAFQEDNSEAIWGGMTCPSGEALQFTANNSVVQPFCMLGQWFVSSDHISHESQVMCVNCIAIKKDTSDAQQPDDSDIKTGVTCPDGYQLTIEYGDSKTQTPVDKLVCTGVIEWDASGGDFSPYPTLDDLITQGIPWTVRCLPKECKELRFGNSNAVCTSKKYDCKAATFNGNDDAGSMTCSEGALRLDSENTPITAMCAKGAWMSGETPIPSDAAVRCISCASVQTGPAPDGNPTVKPSEVTCAPGSQLTIVYDVAGVQKEAKVTTLACSSTSFEWDTTGGGFESFESLAEAVNKGVTWSVKCVAAPSTTCQALTYGRENALCDSKYKCTMSDYVDSGEQSGAMNCPYNGLRLDVEDTPIPDAQCSDGVWSSEGNPIPSDAKVRCTNCKDPITEATTNGVPFIEDNRKVTCANGQGELTVAYVIGGETKETQVSTLFCSPTFDWDTTGGDFAQYGSLAGAVAQGATWTAKCVTITPKPCAALPSDVNEPYCTNDDDGRPLEKSDYRKYGCKTAEFKYFEEGVLINAYMDCAAGKRYAVDPAKVGDPQCLKGKWQEISTGEPISESSKVICVECRPLTKIPEDQIKWDYDNDGTNLSIKCASKQMYIDFRRENKSSSKRFTMASITCNKETQLWDSVGLENGDTIEKLLDRKQLWVVRCLNAGEFPVTPDP